MLFHVLCRGLDRFMKCDRITTFNRMRFFVFWPGCTFPKCITSFCSLPSLKTSGIFLVVAAPEQVGLVAIVLILFLVLPAHRERVPRQRRRLRVLRRSYGGHVG